MKKLFPILLLLALMGQAQATTYYGTNATKRTTVPASAVGQGTDGGRIRHCYDTFAFTADLTLADTIRMCRIPEGATIIDVRLVYTALSAGSLNVGWLAGAAGVEAASSTGFISGVSVSSAGSYSMFTSNQAASGMWKKFSEEVQVQVHPATDTTASSGTIAVEVLYYID